MYVPSYSIFMIHSIQNNQVGDVLRVPVITLGWMGGAGWCCHPGRCVGLDAVTQVLVGGGWMILLCIGLKLNSCN